MSRRGTRTKKPKPKRPKVEWVGGLVETPFTIEPADAPAFSPRMAMWLQRPPGVIVASEVVVPGAEAGAVAGALDQALSRTGAKPTRVRVATQALAEEVRERLAPATPIIVAPTPELDAAIAAMGAAMSNGRQTTYFTHPDVTPAMLERFFAAARALWTSAPWQFAGDTQLIRVDAPSIGVDGACASILGAAGQELGIALFESIGHFDAFVREGTLPAEVRRPLDLGGGELLLSFYRERDLSATMVREAKGLGLEPAGGRAFPSLLSMRRDGRLVGPTAEELALMTAVGAAVAKFTATHRRLFEDGRGAFARETFSWEGAPDVTLTAPYDGVVDDGPAPGRARAHDLESAIFDDLLSFGFERFGTAPFEAALRDVMRAGRPLAMPWLAYVIEIEGATVAEHYARAERLPADVRVFLDAQREAWLSVWEVVDLVPGESIALRDLLSGEERRVRETVASKILRQRSTLLARVVDFEGESVLSCYHSRVLSPIEGAEVVARLRKRLRRKRDVPVERLRGEKHAWFAFECWEEACAQRQRRAARPPRLTNTEGHDLVMVLDRFSYEPRAHDWLLERLARIELVHIDRESPHHAELIFHMEGNPQIESWDNTIVGRAAAARGELSVETNSRERADRLKARILEVAGDIVREGTRSFSDPMADPHVAAMAAREPAPREPAPPEVVALLREHKARHYATWLDKPLPSLHGATPRDHVRTAEGRRAVEVLLAEIEFMEQADPDTAFDVSRLRVALGLPR